MFPSASMRPDQPIANVSNWPASSWLSDVTNSVGSRTTLMPIAFSIDWITWPRRAATGSVPSIRCTVTPGDAPDFANAAFAAFSSAVSLHGIPFVAAYHGVPGATGKQSGFVVLLNTTLLITLRSSASSNAARRSADFAIAVPVFAYGSFPRPFELPMLTVIPWYPIETAFTSLRALFFWIDARSVDAKPSETFTSPERRLAARAAGSVMIFHTIELRCTFFLL